MLTPGVDIDALAGAFSGRLLTEPDDVAPFLNDWRRLWRGRALAVAQPDSVEAVASLVAWCAANRVPIVPQGGNTGLSGGATPDDTGAAIVLSLVRLNRVRDLDLPNGTITVEAGCILKTVQDAADAAGRLFPLSFAAEGSCTIGGALATNAGGTGVLRYGAARELCLGLEVVTAEGEVWNGLRALRKDNSGYDLRDLYIGSEGTLGIITAAVLKLHPKPAARVVAFAAVRTCADAVDLLALARARCDASLTAFELMSNECLTLVASHFPALRRPVETPAPWYVLIELSGPASELAAHEVLEALLTDALEADTVIDAAVAQSLAQSSAFWALRENIAEAQSAEGKTIKHDIAVPISQVAAFLEVVDRAVGAQWPDFRFITFGHLGDGNLHYNFSPPATGDPAAFMNQQDAVNRVVHDLVIAHGGTISAEHGLGVLRRDEAARYKSPVELALMRRLKQALDPNGVMNPGKLLG
ncbi:MAG: linked oxidase domain protein [Caulobacter sp.]|nr:linked oxidase domain protein [Caulobacter sp.]